MATEWTWDLSAFRSFPTQISSIILHSINITHTPSLMVKHTFKRYTHSLECRNKKKLKLRVLKSHGTL